MASGTISGGNYNSIYSYYMTWSSVSNGSVANTSNVTLNWIYKKNASDPYGSYNKSGSSKVTLVINGSSSGAMRADFDLRSASTGTTKTIATYTVNNIPHNSDGTCKINVSGSHATGLSGSNWGTKTISSTEITLDTIPRYATCSQLLNSTTETSIEVNWTSDSYCDTVWYSTDNGSTWKVAEGSVGSLNKKNGSYTITKLSASNTNLSAGTSYNIKTRVRRKDSQLTTDSSKNSWSTNSYPYISAVGTTALTIGNSQTLTLYNPLKRDVTIYMKTGSSGTSGTQLYTGTTNSTSKQFTPTASTLYSQIPNAKSGNCVYYVTYTDSSSATHTSATTSGTTYVVNESGNKPTVTSYTPYDNNSATYALTNSRATIVLNASNMQLTIVANAKNSATFNNGGYIKVNGTSLSLTISGSNATGVYTLNKPTSATYTITLQDSRGIQSGNISYTIPNYVNYFTPTMVGVAKRNQPTDGIINISGSGKFYNGSFGSQSNVLTVEYDVVEYGTTTQLDSGVMTVSTSGNNHSESQIQVSNADYQKQWTITFTVTDKLNSVQSIVQVPKGIPIFNWDNDEFDVNVQLNAKGNTIVGNIKTKNLLELPNRTYSGNNITATIEDGIISISGTYSTQASFTFDITPITLEAGKTYTFAKNQSNNGHYPYLILRDANGDIFGTDYQNSVVSYTPTSDVTITRLGFFINGNDAIGSVLYPQLEEGSVATDWYEHKNLTYSSGQHSNGNYIKYDDGTLIQWGVIAKSNYLNSSTTSTSVQGINWYRSTICTQYYPYEFIDENYSLTLSAQCGTNGSRFIMTDTLTKRVKYFESQLIGVENFTSSGTGYTNLTNVSWIAIGKWK